MRLIVNYRDIDLDFEGSSAEFKAGVQGLFLLANPDSQTPIEPVQDAYFDSFVRPSVPAEYLLPPSHHASALVSSQSSELSELRSMIAALQQERAASDVVNADYRTVVKPKALPAVKPKKSWVSVPMIVALTIASLILGGGLAYRSKNPPPEKPAAQKPIPEKSQTKPAPISSSHPQGVVTPQNQVVCIPLPATKPPECN